MNFFGHAAVAAWRSTDPGFVLGAMLPDLTSMIRARPPGLEHPALDRGVAFHHATDEVFHDTRAFRELSARAFRDLTAAGVRRGPARAVAHVGVEILLDGVLADEALARRAYLGALESAEAHRAHLVWRSELEARAFGELLAGMRARGVSRAHTRPAVVALRVERALGGRPRLALEGDETTRVEHWAEGARKAVRDGAPSIVAELRRELAFALELP